MNKNDVKNLPSILTTCRTEEEVKAAFAKAFDFRLDTRKWMDLYTPEILFEFKHNKNFSSLDTKAKVASQALYYIRELKYGNDVLAVPPYICCVDLNEAFFLTTKDFARVYDSNNTDYDWDRAPSTPCPNIVKAVKGYKALEQAHVFSFRSAEDYDNFCGYLNERRSLQLRLPFEDIEKKTITERNFVSAFNLWMDLFGDYVENGRKASEYFVADLQEGKSFVLGESSEVGFTIANGEIIRKPMPMKEYEYFWSTYARNSDLRAIRGIWQRIDRLTVEDFRRFTGEFYTPVPFAIKALDYIERTVGPNWWERGYRLWDMAAGTGNLEFELPEEALPYCYISTLLEDDANYCKQLFSSATVFQYDYLNDDVNLLFKNQLDIESMGLSPKMPKKLYEELRNPNIKWIVFINPPFVTANVSTRDNGINKDDVSNTTIRQLMTVEGMGEASRELFSQFLWRINREFGGREAYLGLFSKIKYINSNNDQTLRDKVFRFLFERGFCFDSRNFHGNKGSFPVGFLVWNLAECMALEQQHILLDIFDENVYKIGTKEIPSVERNEFLNKWPKRPRTTHIMPPFSSAINVATNRKDIRDKAADGFLGSMMSCGNDFQHQNLTAFFSSPQASAGSFSIVSENFEHAMVMHAVRRIPKATWLNDRDQWMQPTKELTVEFIGDCVIWSLFSNSNQSASLRNIVYKGKTYQIDNEMYPYLLSKIKTWKCTLSTIQQSLTSASRNRYAAYWISKHELSREAQTVLNVAEVVYKLFYANSSALPWPQFKIASWDCGWYQIRGALNEAGLAEEELEAVRSTHIHLGEKLLPQIYEFGFLQGEENFFEEG